MPRMARTASVWEKQAKMIRTAKASLEGRRAHLAAELSEIDRVLAVFSAPSANGSARSRGGTAKGARTRSRGGSGEPREGSLGALAVNALDKAKGKPLGPADVLAEVKAAGYKSKSKERTQLVMVSQTLSKLSKTGHIRRVGRGRYSGT
jgi:hypothetical protein